jgi:hypothetical protein
MGQSRTPAVSCGPQATTTRSATKPTLGAVSSSAWFGWERPVALRGALSGPLPYLGALLLDHLVRSKPHERRDREPEGLGRLEVEDQLKLHRLLDG